MALETAASKFNQQVNNFGLNDYMNKGSPYKLPNDTQHLKDEDLIKTMINGNHTITKKFTPMKKQGMDHGNLGCQWVSSTHQKENKVILSSKKLMESNKCFEYATPKNVYYEGRRVALEEVKHFQTTDEF